MDLPNESAILSTPSASTSITGANPASMLPQESKFTLAESGWEKAGEGRPSRSCIIDCVGAALSSPIGTAVV